MGHIKPIGILIRASNGRAPKKMPFSSNVQFI